MVTIEAVEGGHCVDSAQAQCPIRGDGVRLGLARQGTGSMHQYPAI
jgi:hypothetical protein